jgi:hypothetical protein
VNCRNRAGKSSPQATRSPAFAHSNRGVAHQPRHAVEIGVGTGQIGQPMSLHNCDEESVVCQQTRLLADQGACVNQRGRDGKNLDSELRYLLDRLAELRKLLHLVGLLLQMLHNFRLPAELCRGFSSHQLVGCFTQDMGRGVGPKFVVLDACDQPRTRRPQKRIGGELVNQRVGINKQAGAREEVVKAHGRSSSSSASARICSSSSWVPVQPMMP